MYNLDVADFDTYFVGEYGVLVHNYDQSDIDNAIKKVPDDYKELGRCDDFADSLTKILNKAGIPSQKVKVTNVSGNVIYSEIYEYVGVDYHYGVLVDGKVYDNLNCKTGGMDFDSWLKDMGILIKAIEYKILG